MTICLHATSADNLESILKDGLKTDKAKLWSVSEDGVYFFHLDRYRRANGYTDEDDEYVYNAMLNDSQIQSTIALSKAKDCRIVIVEVDLPDDEVEDDNSCEMMDAACVSYKDIPPSLFRKVLVSNDLGLIRGSFISGIRDHSYLNIDFTREEIHISKLFDNVCVDLFDYVQLEELKLC